jgi:hypothetical protein
MELALTASAFLGTVLGQFILVRIALPGSSVVKYAGLVVLCGLALLATLLGIGADLFTLLACILPYGFACELYLFLFTMVSSSVSVKLLRTLRCRAMDLTDIEKLYDSTGMVSRRLERMASVGLLDPVSQRVTPRGRVLVWAFTFLKRAFRHESSLDRMPARRAA